MQDLLSSYDSFISPGLKYPFSYVFTDHVLLLLPTLDISEFCALETR
jgi:hypothetical protein